MLDSILNATFIAATLRITTPILFPSLGTLLSDRTGVVNIGQEGIMLLAAFTGATVGALLQSWILGLLAGLLVAMAAALLLAFFHLHLNGNLILGGVALNILGSAGTFAIAYQMTLSANGTPDASIHPPVVVPNLTLPFLKGIPLLGDALYTILGDQNLLTWLAFIAAALIWFLLYRMPLGSHLRAVGEYPAAAESVGIRVRRMRYLALGLSGLLAGLGGLHLSMGYLTGFEKDMTAGRGYIALVVPALGNNTPGGTLAAALLFGIFFALEARLNIPDLPSQLPQMIPYVATLIALVVYSLQRRRMALKRARGLEEAR